MLSQNKKSPEGPGFYEISVKVFERHTEISCILLLISRPSSPKYRSLHTLRCVVLSVAEKMLPNTDEELTTTQGRLRPAAGYKTGSMDTTRGATAQPGGKRFLTKPDVAHGQLDLTVGYCGIPDLTQRCP